MHTAAKQLVAIRAGVKIKYGWSLAEGLAVNDVEVGRHSVMHWQASCYASAGDGGEISVNNSV